MRLNKYALCKVKELAYELQRSKKRRNKNGRSQCTIWTNHVLPTLQILRDGGSIADLYPRQDLQLCALSKAQACAAENWIIQITV